jgi:hypothetical protein
MRILAISDRLSLQVALFFYCLTLSLSQVENKGVMVVVLQKDPEVYRFVLTIGGRLKLP